MFKLPRRKSPVRNGRACSTEFGTFLREKGITSAALAEAVGCSEPLIRKYRMGECRPSKTVQRMLAMVLQVKVEAILEMIEKRVPEASQGLPAES
jgi:transcriptional regulator with XRE-family HTH domain